MTVSRVQVTEGGFSVDLGMGTARRSEVEISVAGAPPAKPCSCSDFSGLGLHNDQALTTCPFSSYAALTPSR